MVKDFAGMGIVYTVFSSSDCYFLLFGEIQGRVAFNGITDYHSCTDSVLQQIHNEDLSALV